MQSLYNQKRKSLCLSFATLAVPYYLAHLCSLRLLLNLKSLHHVTQPYAVSIVSERLCSLHRYKIPLQSPNIAPTLKVPPHHARLSVSFCSVYLCGLGVTFAPLRSLLASGRYRALYDIFFAPQVDDLLNGRYIAGTSAGATGGILKSTPAVEAIAPQVDVSTAGKHRPARTEDRR